MDHLISQLQSALDAGKLNLSDAVSARSLLAKARVYGSLTERQSDWAADIVNRASGPAEQVGSGFSRVVDLLKLAGQKLKKPALHLAMDNGDPVVFLLVKTNNRIWIKSSRQYGSTVYGTIEPDLSLRETGRMNLGVRLLIEDLGEDVEGTALRHAMKTGLCCFCNRQLTDERSTKHGYGPVCAANFGLKWD